MFLVPGRGKCYPVQLPILPVRAIFLLFHPSFSVMDTPQSLIRQAYAGFNARDIPRVLATLHPQVRWSKAWEGDYATGHDEVSAYWQRQWQELDPHVEPTRIIERADGRLEVTVQQLVKDRQGTILFEGQVKHLYTLQEGLVQQMDIEQG